jgi:hypothetical protein
MQITVPCYFAIITDMENLAIHLLWEPEHALNYLRVLEQELALMSYRFVPNLKNFTPVLRLQPLLPKIPLVPVKILSTIPRS